MANAGGRAKFVIQPFKHNQQMDEEYANKTWQTLHNAIHEIHKQNASGLSFEELYCNAYNMVLHKFGDKLYQGLSDTITAHLRTVADQVQTTNDTEFLSELKDKWDKHKVSSIMQVPPSSGGMVSWICTIARTWPLPLAMTTTPVCDETS